MTMRLREALRLRRGDRVSFCDSGYNRSANWWAQGEVLFVTSRGGVRVRVTDQAPWFGPADYSRRFGTWETWVPYHHIGG